MFSINHGFEWVATGLFALALIHTFSAKFFDHLAVVSPKHAGVWHLLGEVEVVFGFWAAVLVLFLFTLEGKPQAISYLNSLNFTEPLFVFAIMVVAGTRPILSLVMRVLTVIARCMPVAPSVALYWTLLVCVPLLGSLVTEPAAMTLAALMLAQRYFSVGLSERTKYITLGVLFVNVSIGGTLTSFAAPPVLMVAATWGWDSLTMLSTIGWKAGVAVLINGSAATWYLRRELAQLQAPPVSTDLSPVPALMVLTHVLFLCGIVVFAHYPVIFLGLFMLFLGVASAYPQFQDRLMIREGLLVAFFLAGLVVLGGLQRWWLEPLLRSLSDVQVFAGATLLTAITDNAALTYLGSLVEGLSPSFKYALVTGAVTGGGLTIIANAPNPAGAAILREYFYESEINAGGLLLAAILPTLVAAACFTGL